MQWTYKMQLKSHRSSEWTQAGQPALPPVHHCGQGRAVSTHTTARLRLERSCHVNIRWKGITWARSGRSLGFGEGRFTPERGPSSSGAERGSSQFASTRQATYLESALKRSAVRQLVGQ